METGRVVAENAHVDSATSLFSWVNDTRDSVTARICRAPPCEVDTRFLCSAGVRVAEELAKGTWWWRQRNLLAHTVPKPDALIQFIAHAFLTFCVQLAEKRHKSGHLKQSEQKSLTFSRELMSSHIFSEAGMCPQQLVSTAERGFCGDLSVEG